MKKEAILLVLVVLILLIVISKDIFAMAQQEYSVIAYTSNSETSCEDGVCETTVYSYEKYWFNDQGEWEEIYETWFDCSDKQGIKFCTQEYHYNATLQDLEDLSVFVYHNYTTSGNYTIIATGFGDRFTDSRSINITV